jgi:hypothetical protein
MLPLHLHHLRVSMISSSKYKHVSKRIFVGLATAVLLFASIANSSLGKPSTWSYKISDNLLFDFKECTKSTNAEDLVCTGYFRSQNGEQTLHIGPGSDSYKNVTITDSRGGVHLADEVKIGDDWSCRLGANCGARGIWQNVSGAGYVDFVEGVRYKTTFLFKGVSLPSSKIALFFLKNPEFSLYSYQVKVRNINVLSK